MSNASVKIQAHVKDYQDGSFNVERVRADFPTLQQYVNNRPLVYLDSAATTQKPQAVIDAVTAYYTEHNANVHRGVHELSRVATGMYEAARKKVRAFMNAAGEEEIVFVRGATEGINLVAQSYARPLLHVGDEILISEMEHHSNIVPWQMVCEQTGAALRVIPINDNGELRLDEFEKLLSEKTRIVAVTQISNALGTVNPVRHIIRKAHEFGAPVLIDGAQSIQHLPVDMQELDCDFFVMSGHKMYGPTGIGVLYGKKRLLDAMPPYQGGGDMILSVTFEKTLYNSLPYKFEAGTPHIAGAIGLGAALDYFSSFNLKSVMRHEAELLAYATDRLLGVPGLRIIGTAQEKASVISFQLCAIHPHDIGTILDREGIAIRAGHHCAQPVMKRFGLPATARASFAIYNTKEDIDVLIQGIYQVLEIFS
jgi:cysteine desulfurase / selenocysteine lyase